MDRILSVHHYRSDSPNRDILPIRVTPRSTTSPNTPLRLYRKQIQIAQAQGSSRGYAISVSSHNTR